MPLRFGALRGRMNFLELYSCHGADHASEGYSHSILSSRGRVLLVAFNSALCTRSLPNGIRFANVYSCQFADTWQQISSAPQSRCDGDL
jgi:hypothetical protein